MPYTVNAGGMTGANAGPHAEREIVRLASMLLGLVVSLGACSVASTPPKPESTEGVPLLGADCDPIVPSRCGFPMPSNVYLAGDPRTVTGKRVAFGRTSLPAFAADAYTDPRGFGDLDGFSPGQPILTDMPGATITGLPTQDDLERSLGPDSPTVIIEADTGARVPHFAELDMSSFGADKRALIVRPVVRLKDATRYIVAIRRVVDGAGAALPPSPVFQALRDGSASDDPSVDRRRTLYADLFARLASAGIDKADLQLAWDFTTSSRANHTAALLHMRDDALAKVGPDGPSYVVTKIEENPNPHVRRRITGTMTVPLYLDTTALGGHLALGDDGLPKENGTADYDFVVHIPNSVADGGKPAPLLQNGHGLLGTKSEGEDTYLAEFADEKGYVAFAVDLVGMASDESAFLADALTKDIGGFRSSVDRQHQGMLNSLLAMRLMKGAFARDPNVVFQGASVIDPTRAFYRGDSQGGIFGVTYLALSTDVTRGLLGEPGMPYSLLLNRSADFSGFSALLHIIYRDPRDVQIIFGLMQMLWDRTEPDGYAPYVTRDMLPGTPAHTVLLHVAIGDHQVTPLGAHVIARAVGATNVKPLNRSVWGIPEASAPVTGSGMVEYSFGLPDSPKTNIPPDGSSSDDPHDKLRVLPFAEDQVDEFFREGTIAQFCSDACRPE
jgi:hypothetical protein